MDVRTATWNIEHFNKLFSDTNAPEPPRPDEETRFRITAQRQLEAAVTVIRRLDPDLLLVIEAPGTSQSGTRDTVEALENLARVNGLRCSRAAIGFNSSGHQEIAVMFDPERITVTHAPDGAPLAMTRTALDALDDAGRIAQLPLALDTLTGRKVRPAPRFDTIYPFDSEDDRLLELYRFTRPPFEARVGVLQDGAEQMAFRMIGAHVKSKGNYDVKDDLRDDIKNLANRRRILAECSWIRARVEEYLDAGETVLVAGDFNDGPGLGYHERSFGRSAVELVAGVLSTPDRILWTNMLKPSWSGSKGWSPSTASFYQKDSGKFFNALIDFILVSRDLYARGTDGLDSWRIWDPWRSNDDDEELTKALKDASDHYPVTFDFTVGG